MHVLVVYGTTEGQTRKIVAAMADHLKARGHAVEVVEALAAPADLDVARFDAAIVAASLHAGHYQAAVLDFARRHRDGLDALPSAFVSVSLAAASQDEDDLQGLERCVADFARQTGWTPRHLHHVAGAFRYTQYDFLKRWALKYIAWRKGASTDTSSDHELTDWDDLARFVATFVGAAEQERRSA
jgi:menaquinone-dependent protoporphyrinogen oxidase